MTTRSADDAGAFLDRCRRGSGAAYEAFKELLERHDPPDGHHDPTERSTARRLLGAVVARLFEHGAPEAQQEAFHVAVRRLPAGAAAATSAGSPDDLTLLQLPGVFAPEEWSYTFFEGLARYPAGELEGLTVAELGCGNGWISLALARRSLPRTIYALDINPRAVACARLNLYLNGLDDDGAPVVDASGRSLLDRVEVGRSDLLAWCREREVRLDRVVGCIPQVLRPDLETTLEAVSETASDEFLYSLSNYTGKQGYVEDQFGLGLIARAVEESVELLRPAGRMVFNLGGRPGRGGAAAAVRAPRRRRCASSGRRPSARPGTPTSCRWWRSSSRRPTGSSSTSGTRRTSRSRRPPPRPTSGPAARSATR